MLIDIHGHLGKLGDYDGTAEALGLYQKQVNADRLFVSNLHAAAIGADQHEPDANVDTLALCKAQKGFCAVYWVRPGGLDSNIHAFAGALDLEPFVGALFAPRYNGFRADDELLDRYMAVLLRLGRPAMFLTSPDDADRPSTIYTLARRHPRVPVVLLNIATDRHWPEALDTVRRSQQRDDAIILLSLAHATADDALAAVNAARHTRVLFGSDAGLASPTHTERVQTFLEEFRATAPPAVCEAVLWQNAQKLFGLKFTPAATPR